MVRGGRVAYLGRVNSENTHIPVVVECVFVCVCIHRVC